MLSEVLKGSVPNESPTQVAILKQRVIDLFEDVSGAKDSIRLSPISQPGSGHSDIPSRTEPVASQMRLLTTLGHTIIHSSDTTTPTVIEGPSLPRAKNLVAAATNGIIAVDSTAKQFQAHANVWQNLIATGISGGQLHINGDTLDKPSLVSVDSIGNLVKVPLSLAVGASSKDIPLTAEIKPAAIAALVTSDVSSLSSSTTVVPTSTTVAIPQALTASSLDSDAKSIVPPDFVLVGNIKLFGGAVDAEYYTFKSASGGDDKAALAVLRTSPTSMDELLPNQGFGAGNIMLKDATVQVYSKTTSTGPGKGLWLDAKVTLDGTLANAGTILKDIFSDDVPTLDISVHLGDYQNLTDAFKAPADLTLKAALSGLDVKVSKFLELTSAEINIHGVRPAGQSYIWTVGLTGTALLTVPGSVTPLMTKYTISKTQSTYAVELRLTQDQWSDAMGVPGFHLHDVLMKTSFTNQNQAKALTYNITASFALGTTIVDIVGSYADDQWSFHANVGDFSLQKLQSAFTKLFNANLSECRNNVVFTGLSLDVNSKDKRLLLQGAVNVDTYDCAKATLSIGPTGVQLTGDMTDVKFDKITLTKAHMELMIVKDGLINPDPLKPGVVAAFTISGEIQIHSVTIDAEVSFAKSSNASMAWVVYAKAATSYALSSFVSHDLSDLDLKLESVIVMASNTDDEKLFPPHSFQYTVKKGFHLHAKIDCPPKLAEILHTTPIGIDLEVDLGSAQQEVEFIFAGDQQLALKPGMVSPSIKAGFMLTENPQIFVEGDMLVQLRGQPEPLKFALRLQAGPTEAQASASLMTDWINPFDISPKVKVLAPVTLGVIIDYAAVTYPSGVSFQGGLQVGETLLHAAFEVGENPQDGVLLVHAENLGIRDIVSFASLVIDHQLPKPASDFLYFKDLYLGLSSGGTIGSVYYPAGVTFNSDMLVFGKEVKVNCVINKELPGLKLHAEVDAFQLGPLTVSGNTTKNPTLDLQFGTTLQHMFIDGKIVLFDFEIATTVKVDMVPLAITFDADLEFSDLLTFKLEAQAIGDIKSIKDVVKADFALSVDFEQKLLDQMMALATTYITAGKKASDEGLDSAQQKLTSVQKDFDDHVALCNRDLAAAKVKWDKKSADVHAAVEARKSAIKAQEQAKRDAVNAAQAAFNAKIRALEDSLTRTKNDAAAKVKAAQDYVTQAKRDTDQKIADARKKLDDATSDMRNRFGSAEQSIRDAQSKVDIAQAGVNSIQGQIDKCTSWYDKPKLPALYAAKGVATGALDVAKGVLAAANAVMSSAAYSAAKAAMSMAQDTLNSANIIAQRSMDAANGSLSAAKAAESASVAVAQQTLEAAKNSCDELHVWQAAQVVLDTYLKGEAALLSAADALFQELSSCVEKISFDAASKALDIAKSATKELDAAKAVIQEVKSAADEFAAFGKWLNDHMGNIFNVKSVQLSGSLNDVNDKKPFHAHIKGTFAAAQIDETVDFYPGKGEDFVKGLVLKYVNEAKSDLGRFIKAH